jgi:hypothetical protein
MPSVERLGPARQIHDPARISAPSVRHERHLRYDQAAHQSTKPAEPLPLPLDLHYHERTFAAEDCPAAWLHLMLDVSAR